MEQTKFVHKILFHGQNCFTCCIKWPSSSTRHIWDINKSVFRLRSPPQDISWCLCNYSKFTVTKSKSIWVRDPTCTCHLLLTEGLAWFVSHWAPYWNGISISNAHARLKLWVGSYSAVSWNPEVSTMTPFRRTSKLVPVQMGLGETNYFRPSGAGRAWGAGRRVCGLTSLLTTEFSHDLILTHSLEFLQYKPRLLAIGSCNKIPSHCIFKKKQLGV